jgi:hypothetical protein
MRRHQMGEPTVAQVLAAVAQIVGLRRVAFGDTLFDAAPNVMAVDRQHGIDVGIA